MLLKQKDENAFNLLYEKYHKLVMFSTAQILKNKDDVADVTNQTFEIVWNNINKQDENKSFKYWLLTIAKNEALKVVNERNRQIYKVDDFSNNQIEDSVDNFSNYINLEVIKEALNEEELKIFVYHVLYQMNFNEIGKIVGKSRSSCHRIYQEAILKLAKKI